MAVTKGVFAGAALLALGEGRQFCLGTFAMFVPRAADCDRSGDVRAGQEAEE